MKEDISVYQIADFPEYDAFKFNDGYRVTQYEAYTARTTSKTYYYYVSPVIPSESYITELSAVKVWASSVVSARSLQSPYSNFNWEGFRVDKSDYAGNS